MVGGRFACLRTHSWYSWLEGVDSPESLLARAAECGYTAVALTDTNSLTGAVEFTEAAGRHGVRPILGACLRHGSQRCTALIAEPAGYRSLCRVLSRLHFQPGAQLAPLLCDNADGLQLLVDDPLFLKAPLTDAFRGRLWLELVRPGRSEAAELALMDVGSRHGLRPVASLGARFALPSGHGTYRLATAVRQGQPLDQLPARLPVTAGHHLATVEEVHERFRDLPQAVANAVALGDLCRSDVLPRGTVQPPCHVPTGQDAPGHLRAVCERAFRQRQWPDAPTAAARLDQELVLITQRDLASYFLAVGDLAEEARRRHWPLALRGSAGASLVLHLLGVTEADPLRHGLRFERFLNVARENLPDIDIDLATQELPRVWNWLVQRHGPDHVARVGSVEHMGARSALGAACLAFGLVQGQADAVVAELGAEVEGLKQAEAGERLTLAPQSWPLDPAGWPRLVAAARALVGRPRRLGKHPSGVVLTAAPVEDFVPLQKGPGNVRLAQFNKDAVERVGVVKLDLLSNRALSVVAEARQHLQAINPEAGARQAENGDPATLDLLARGDTLGISQLETPSVRRLLRQVRPAGFEDIVHVLAVTRPGALPGRETYLKRRHGLEAPAYAHASLEPVLRDSLGVLLTEDDALSVVEALAGVPAAEADRLRRRLADADTAAEAVPVFVSACERNGVPKAAAEEVCGLVRRFEAYSFCKAHAAGYARVAWQEAWLKAHAPLAFWTASLNNHQGDYARRTHVEAVKRAGLAVYGPCVNRSRAEFAPEVSGVRTGLSAVRRLGKRAVETVLEERDKGGPFVSFKDFRSRVSLASTDLACLIRAGALDCFGRGRQVLLREADLLRYAQQAAGRGQDGEPWPGEPLEGHPLTGQWLEEWQLLGFLPGGAPLMHLLRASLPHDLTDSRALAQLEGEAVRLAGLVALNRPLPGEEEPGLRLTLEDEWGLVEVAAGPGTWDGEGAEPPGPLLVAEGRVELRYGVPLVVAEKLARPLPGSSAGASLRLFAG